MELFCDFMPFGKQGLSQSNLKVSLYKLKDHIDL